MIGKRIAALRSKSKLTQAEFAQKLGVSRSALSLWEQGRRKVDQDLLIVIANFFGVTTDTLLGRDAIPPNELVPVTTEPLDPSIERMNDPVMDGIMDNLQLMSPEERETFWRLSQSVVNRQTKGVS